LENDEQTPLEASGTRLHDSDLLVLVTRKLGQVQRWLELSQQQFALIELNGLDLLVQEKETVVAEVRRLDALIERWWQEHQRSPTQEERKTLRELQTTLDALQESENAFVQRLQTEKQQVSRELGQLQTQTRYLQPKPSRVGQLLGLRRKPTY
jgi:hypothetical protein